MKMRIPLYIPLLLLASCGFKTQESNLIATSFYPIYHLAKQIAGEQMEVINLTPSGSDPHDYELTPSSRASLSSAKLICLNGLNMEHWASSLSSDLLSKSITLSEGIETEQIDGGVDPHIWLNTKNYLKMGEVLLGKLKEIDPDNASIYQNNFASFSSSLSLLEAMCEEISSSFANKAIAVSHAAYGYMCNQWNIEQIHIAGLSPDEEPSAKQLSDLVDEIKERHIDTVFYEELSSKDLAEFIAKQTGAKTESLNPLEGLTQEEEKEGKDYFSIYLEDMQKIGRASND